MTEAVNTFTNGMVMDLHPLTTPNNVLTNCLNGTYITYNGNEMILQNDMGNGRVETAKLPAGYIPVGVVSHGGIIYVASYNPIELMSLIGCFPSPERNISSEDTGMQAVSFTPGDDLVEEILGKKYLKEAPVRKNVALQEIHPGDLFMVASFPEEDWFKTELVSITDSNLILPVTSRFTVEDDEVKPTWTYYSSKYPGLLAFQFTPYLLKEFSVAYDISKIQSENTSEGCLKLKWDSVPENENAPLAKVEVEAYYVSGDFKELAFRGTDNFLTDGNWLFVTEENTEYNHLDLTHQLNIDPSPIDPLVKKIGVRVTPMMKYIDKNGQEDYARIRTMSKYFEVDVDAIDSNAIDLNEYRYKVTLDNESATGKLLLSYGFSGDLADGVEITDCTLDIFDLDDNPIFGKNNPILLKKQLGYFTIELEFDDTFKSNSLYIVLFNIIAKKDGVLKRENKEARFLYTSTVMNLYYSNGRVSDFGKKEPNLIFTPEIKVNNNIELEYNPNKSGVGKLALEVNDITETKGFSYYDLKNGVELQVQPKFSDPLFELTANHTNTFESRLDYDLTIFEKDLLLTPETKLEISKQDENEDELNISEGYVKSMIYCENILVDTEYSYVWTPLVYNRETAEENNLIFDESIKHFTNEKFTYLGGYDYPTSGYTSGSPGDDPGLAMCGLATVSRDEDNSNSWATVITSEGELKNTRASYTGVREVELSTTSSFGLQNNKICNEVKGSIIPTLLAYKPSRYAGDNYMRAFIVNDIDYETSQYNEAPRSRNNYWEINYQDEFDNNLLIYGYKIPELTDEGASGSSNIPVMLQVKNTSDVYVPINVWPVINCGEYNQGILLDKGGFKFGKTVGDLIFYILNQIYVRRESSEVYKENEKRWVVDRDSIRFIKNYTVTVKIDIVSKWTNSEVTKINNKPVSYLLNLAAQKGISCTKNLLPTYTLSDTPTYISKDFEVIQYKNSEYDSRSYTSNLVGVIRNSNNLVGISNSLSGRYAYVNEEGKLVSWDNNAQIYEPGTIEYDYKEDIIIGNYNFSSEKTYSLADFKINNGKLLLTKNTDKFAIRILCALDLANWFIISGFNRNATFFEGLKLVD